jgi:spermidine synthase
MDDPRHSSPVRCDAEIFFVSALILYLELVLIRWIGTEIRIFAYLGNLILVVCFFGAGLGCFRSKQPIELSRLGINLVLLVVLVENPRHLSQLDLSKITLLLSGFEDSPVWGGVATNGVQVLAGLIVVGALLYLATSIFVPAGQILGRLLDGHPRTIHAYSVNIAGSLTGVWLFNALSYVSSPPSVWLAVAAAMAVPAVAGFGRTGWTVVALVAVSAGTVWWGDAHQNQTVWSPYQKLVLTPIDAVKGTNRVPFGYSIAVNGSDNFQYILNLSGDFLAAHPDIFEPELVPRSHYNLPFCFKSPIRRMLIVGAGAGNNAAAALRHGVEQVDCLEIDPRVYSLGKTLHPERPYDSPRVRMIVNDARASFKQITGPYDAIWFGVLDAHTQGSSYNNLRLDHYVYTLQSLQEARRLLADDGILVLSFGSPRPWVADRLFVTLQTVFGHDPLTLFEDQSVQQLGWFDKFTFVTGHRQITPECVMDPSLRDFVRSRIIKPPGTTQPATDDWPYLYLQSPKIPKLHTVVSVAILGVVSLMRRRITGIERKFDWHFFALGAAFLLLEVQTVSRATLLFGMTWIVNAIVISAVLVMILLANLVAWRWPRLPQWSVITGLAITVAALALVPLDWFNTLTGVTKLVAASAFLTAPVFFAGLIFIQSFATCPDKARALGSNLIGALVGGLLEALSFVTGIRALVILVGLFYWFAILRRPASAR